MDSFQDAQAPTLANHRDPLRLQMAAEILDLPVLTASWEDVYARMKSLKAETAKAAAPGAGEDGREARSAETIQQPGFTKLREVPVVSEWRSQAGYDPVWYVDLESNKYHAAVGRSEHGFHAGINTQYRGDCGTDWSDQVFTSFEDAQTAAYRLMWERFGKQFRAENNQVPSENRCVAAGFGGREFDS